MLANPNRFRRKWGKPLQKDFDQTLRLFDKASPQDWEPFENDTNSLTSEREPWLRISEAYGDLLDFRKPVGAGRLWAKMEGGERARGKRGAGR